MGVRECRLGKPQKTSAPHKSSSRERGAPPFSGIFWECPFKICKFYVCIDVSDVAPCLNSNCTQKRNTNAGTSVHCVTSASQVSEETVLSLNTNKRALQLPQPAATVGVPSAPHQKSLANTEAQAPRFSKNTPTIKFRNTGETTLITAMFSLRNLKNWHHNIVLIHPSMAPTHKNNSVLVVN